MPLTVIAILQMRKLELISNKSLGNLIVITWLAMSGLIPRALWLPWHPTAFPAGLQSAGTRKLRKAHSKGGVSAAAPSSWPLVLSCVLSPVLGAVEAHVTQETFQNGGRRRRVGRHMGKAVRWDIFEHSAVHPDFSWVSGERWRAAA